MRHITAIIAVSMVMALVGTVAADWAPDTADPRLATNHKMHYPQMPDESGWDVRITNSRRELTDPLEWVVADDWRCSSSGWVTDVHFWVSWESDMSDQIDNIHLSIHADIPAGTGGISYSRPAELALWTGDFGPGDFVINHDGIGVQGWFDPPFGDDNTNDHEHFYQVNIVDIPGPFEQVIDTIYWLDISVDLHGEAETGKLGWKTSNDHFGDDAVYWDTIDQKWLELRDPITDDSLDMAFVITPEPATLSLLVLGGLSLLRRRRK